MDSFEWDKYFVTGVADIDNDHHFLVDLVNKFGQHISENAPTSEGLTQTFNELMDFAGGHFKNEERLMMQAGIDPRHLGGHIDIHHDFLNEVSAMFSAVAAGSSLSAKDLLEFLTNWLAYHTLGTDKNMARQLLLIGEGTSPAEAYDIEERDVDSATAPLLTALNNLFNQVSERNKQLVELNQTLEVKVASRTRELSEANQHLKMLALTDVLTGLPNRRQAMQALSMMWNDAVEKGESLVCMMIDADHFKEVNDTYGHDAGDHVLQTLSNTLRHTFRNDDIVCRLGGDEFFIIAPDTDLQGGMTTAEITRKKVSELKVATGDGFWNSSISIGVAARTNDMQSSDDLIKRADDGVYAAKRDGKNCVRTIC